MTPEEIQELRDWSARKMGWTTGQTQFQLAWFDAKANFKMFKSQWLPDRPESGQIWMLVERMRELGFSLRLTVTIPGEGGDCQAEFIPDGGNWYKEEEEWDQNPCLAILKAARATED